MTGAQSTHPAPNLLREFAWGQLSELEHAEIEGHVEQCDQCCQFLQSVPDDTLIARLRDATPPTLDWNRNATQPHADREGEFSIPAELVDHPRYRIVRQLGAGGMGVVYEAEHRVMERHVALKVINRRLLDRPETLERFRLEVKAAAKLTHPNIVTAFDAERAGNLHFLVMEFVAGVSLAEQVVKHGPLPIVHACHYVRQAALGLQHASERGMVHRDIKPHNLMLAKGGRIKILDFGLARFARESDPANSEHVAADLSSSSLTAAGSTLGTPDYIAPEQAANSRKADIRADIYSLGCTFYFILTGQPPFPGGTAVEKILAHATQSPRPLAELRADIPADVIAIIERMLAKSPKDRFQTPEEVAKALLPLSKPGLAPVAAAAAPTLHELPALEEFAKFETTAQPLPRVASASAPSWKKWGADAAKWWSRNQRLALLSGAGGLLVLVAWNSLPMIRNRASRSLADAQPVRQVTPPQPPTQPQPKPKASGFQSSRPAPPTPVVSQTSTAIQSRILVVIPKERFWFGDLEGLRIALENHQLKNITLASSVAGTCQPALAEGAHEVTAVVALRDVKPQEYDVIIFSGANPTENIEFWQDPEQRRIAHALIRGMNSSGKIVAGICVGNIVVADSGIANGDGVAHNQFIPQAFKTTSQVTWRYQPVVIAREGRVITGKDQTSAAALVAKILEMRELALDQSR